jgi:cytochrome c oxidase subunit 4
MSANPTAEGQAAYPRRRLAEHEGHGPGVRVYYTIFVCLGILTFITVLVSKMPLPPVAAVVLAFLIAISKATLVVSFFMHLKYDPKVLRIICLVPTLLTLLLVIALLPDVGMKPPGVAGVPDTPASHAPVGASAGGEDGEASEH